MEKKRRNVTMQAKYQNKNCIISLTFIVFFYYSVLSASDWFLITLTLEFSLSFTSMEPSCVQKE